MTDNRKPILETGENCWRVERAGRAAVLIDAAAYYGALRQALLKAKRSVFLIGWDIDSRVEIRGEEEPEDGAPVYLGRLLNYLVEKRPDLQVHVLLWDYSVVYALEREPLPSLNLDWLTPKQIKVCLDDVLPLGACHHQKVVVIDDAIAFCGGLDLTIRRWDTPEHRPDHPMRRDPSDKPYAPFHDIQMCVDGDAAAALAEVARHRWHNAACEAPAEIAPVGDPWPESLYPDFKNVDIAIARTIPATDGDESVREVEALFLTAIDRAEHHIYIENQFLTAHAIAKRLAQRMQENENLEVLIVGPETHASWLEARSMKVGRTRFLQRLHEADVLDRVRLVHPFIRSGDDDVAVMVHAKLMIVDDVFLRIGSANLNNRSMGMDSECDLAIEARDDAQRRTVKAIRNRLMAEHLGASETAVAEKMDEHNSLLAAIDELAIEDRGLRLIDDGDEYAEPIVQAVTSVADPERPIEASSFIGDMFGAEPTGRVLGRIGTAASLGCGLIALALAWRFTPLSEVADPEMFRTLLSGVAANPWAPIVMVSLYILGGLAAFPVTVLIAGTAMVFEPWVAFAYAGAGSLISAAVTYLVGAKTGRNLLRDLMGVRLNRISRALARKGTLSVMAVRLVPVAPFTLVNLVAGVSHIRFHDFVLGTILGMAPGLIVITALGHRLARMLKNPSGDDILVLGLIVLAWVALSIALQFLVRRLQKSSRA